MAKQKVNYLRHHKAVMLRISGDDSLSAIDVSMYNALFLLWNASGWESNLSINRSEVMSMAKVGNKNTYTESLKTLHAGDYLAYRPSHNPLIGSVVTLTIFGKSEDEDSVTKGGKSSGNTTGKSSGKGGGTYTLSTLTDLTHLTDLTTGTNVPGAATASAGEDSAISRSPKNEAGKSKKDSAQKKKEVTAHWHAVAEAWISFHREKTGVEPTFWEEEGAKDRKALASIMKRLLKQTKDNPNTKDQEWTEEYAIRVLNHFLKRAYADKWRAENFRLPILSSHYDSIVNPNGQQQSNSKNGQSTTGGNVDLNSTFGKIDELYRNTVQE